MTHIWYFGQAAMLAAMLAAAPGVVGQPRAVPLSVSAPLGTFESAVALATVPGGELCVLDSEAGTITRLDSSGTVLAVWGGSGAGSYAFDRPEDFDPTNGLMFYVADTGNRVIKRFSGEFLHLESIRLDLSATQAGLQAGREDPFGAEWDGRPLAVRASMDGTLYAVDEERAVVVKWTTARRVERVIGGYDAGDGQLVRPVALALGADGSLYVADAGQDAVVVFDRFGNFRGKMAEGLARDVQGVVARERRIFVVLPKRILIYETARGLAQIYAVELDEPLRDVAVANRTLYLLTATALYAAAP